MATVINPESDRVQASFAAVAKHYGVQVLACPPRRGNRKGVVEKANHVAAQRFWRTLPDDVTVEQAQAQARLDAWCAARGDTRLRATAGGTASVATVAAAEPLRSPPALPFPATLRVSRTVSAQALMSFRGNRYSVGPGRPGRRAVTPTGRKPSDSNERRHDVRAVHTRTASLYQRLRGHLATLTLHAAAEALPGVLDSACLAVV